MLLSKQEFNKLSKKDQQKLLNFRPTVKGSAKKKNPRKKSGRQRQTGSNQVAAAAAYSTGLSTKAPNISMTRDRCRIKHRELLLSVVGSAAFTVAAAVPINPGLPTSFPWLSIIAQAWEEYEFHSLKFHYFTRTGTSVPGSVLMVVDYDAADDPPVGEQVASAYEGAVEDAPWKDISLNVRKAAMIGPAKKHFLRNAALPANLDIKTYDVGQFFLCTLDGTAVPWGKIWVEYDVEFTIPQLPPSGGTVVLGGTISSNGGETTLSPFGTNPAINIQSVGIDMDNSSTLTFSRPGTYLCAYQVTGVGLTAFPSATLVNCTVVASSPTILADGTQIELNQVVEAQVAGATILQGVTGTSVSTAALLVGSGPPGAYD